jgi:hypothetical protein
VEVLAVLVAELHPSYRTLDWEEHQELQGRDMTAGCQTTSALAVAVAEVEQVDLAEVAAKQSEAREAQGFHQASMEHLRQGLEVEVAASCGLVKHFRVRGEAQPQVADMVGGRRNKGKAERRTLAVVEVRVATTQDLAVLERLGTVEVA